MATAWLAIGLAGCGGDREEELAEASEALGDARGAVEQARQRVTEKQEKVERAQEELAEARDRLREAEARLIEAESEVDVSATDAVLFRTIQRKLLEDDALEGFAIQADVSQGVVTLSGQVEKEKQRERAEQIASATPGVARVQNEIELTGPPEQDL
jgi:osmotically-inducible protein OsmY